MSAVKNHTIYDTDINTLKRLCDEYKLLGRDAQVYEKENKLVVFALPRGSKSRKRKRQDAKKAKR